MHRHVGFKGLFAFWSYFCAQRVFLSLGATFVHRRMGFKGLFPFWSYSCAQARGFYRHSSVRELILCTGAWVLRVFLSLGATFVHRRMGFKDLFPFWTYF